MKVIIALLVSASVAQAASDFKGASKNSAGPLVKQEASLAPDLSNGSEALKMEALQVESSPSWFKAPPAAHPNPVPAPGPGPGYQRVYCAFYADQNVSGYSIYRHPDHKDIGNAVWTVARYECEDAAEMANRVRAGLVCSKYHNENSGQTDYSVYRIRDNKDLGNAVIRDFQDCQGAVTSARRGIFCSTYAMNGQTWWSMYSIRTGEDLGKKVYATLEECRQQY